MTLTLTLPDDMAAALQNRPQAKHQPVEELAVELLAHSLEEGSSFPTPEEVVAMIKATPPRPGSIRRSQGSLADALQRVTPDPNFDLQEWQREWDKVEAEMKATTRANEIREGRG